MKALIQRVISGAVFENGKELGRISRGYVVFVGVKQGDTTESAAELARRVLRLQLFSSSDGKMKNAIAEAQGELLLVPEITLYAGTKGGRVDFDQAEESERAKELFDSFTRELRKSGLNAVTGEFGAHMQVELTNDGPVTVLEEV